MRSVTNRISLRNLCNERLFLALKNKEVVKIGAHPEGKHYLALTKNSEVYSWGSGEGGRLGKIYKRYLYNIFLQFF